MSGTLVARSAGGSNSTTVTQAITGQYLPGTRVAALNFGDVGANRVYAIGRAPEDRTGQLELTVFRLRPAQGVTYERSVSFRYKGPLAQPEEDPKRGPRMEADVAASDVIARGSGR